jgi:UDP-N-acetylglucosamine 3-dehydrogenase
LDTSPDIVDICTPPFTHCEIAVKAAESGCHVLVEKPLAMDAKEAETMIKVARLNSIKMCVVHNFLYSHAMKKS